MLSAGGSVLRTPGVARLTAATFVGALALGMAPIGFIVFIRDATGSYASAGSVLAAFSVGRAIATPPQR
jgi:hypothetical protein